MCPKPPLEAYAEDICFATKVISVYCQSSSHPHPSFDAQAQTVTIPSSAPEAVLSARQTLLTATLKVQQLAIEPRDYLPQLTIHYQNFACVHWLCHFRILSFIPLHGSVPYSEVAMVASVPEAQLTSIARMAMTSNFLREPTPGELSHSVTSALFVTTPSLLDWALFMAETAAPAAAGMVHATERWGATEQKSQTAFNIAKNTDLPFSEYLSQSPSLCKQYAAYKNCVAAGDEAKLPHLLNGFDWASLGREATVVEVGSSSCDAGIALATAYPNLRLTVQVHPAAALADCHARLSALSRTVRSRITCKAHNPLTPQPQPVNVNFKEGGGGVDAFLLHAVFHDHSPAEATSILQNLLPALKPPTKNTAPPRLIIMDVVLPTPTPTQGFVVPALDEALLRVRDLNMMQAFNRHERDLNDWNELFATAGAGTAEGEGRLVLKNITKPLGSLMSVMEVVYSAHAHSGVGVEQQNRLNGI